MPDGPSVETSPTHSYQDPYDTLHAKIKELRDKGIIPPEPRPESNLPRESLLAQIKRRFFRR